MAIFSVCVPFFFLQISQSHGIKGLACIWELKQKFMKSKLSSCFWRSKIWLSKEESFMMTFLLESRKHSIRNILVILVHNLQTKFKAKKYSVNNTILVVFFKNHGFRHYVSDKTSVKNKHTQYRC